MNISDLKQIENIHFTCDGASINILPDDGYILTPYVDGQEIKDYVGQESIAINCSYNILDFRVITMEEHEDYSYQRYVAINNQMKELENSYDMLVGGYY